MTSSREAHHEQAALAWDAERDGICSLPIRLRSPVDWALDAERGAVRVHMDRAGRDAWYKPRIAPVLEGLEAGDDLPALVERLCANEPGLARAAALRSARSLVTGLATQGNVEVVLPPVPPVFAGRYERVAELGRGGVGVAWLCHDREDGDTPVVVKHAWNWSGPLDVRDRTLRDEGAVLRSLDHPGVVGFVDAFELDDRYHLVRDFVDGEELTHRVLRDGPPGAPERARTLRAIGDALGHLHDRDIVCLDLKPSNFMEDEGRWVLADLGHCRRLEGDIVELGGAWGTKGFTAPETARNGLASVASDVYGLGCLAAFLVTGRAAPSKGSVEGLLARARGAGASAGELAFLEAACQPDPAARPTSVGDALELLDR